MTRIEREINDTLIMDKCHKCCLSCKKYKTVKEQYKECEVFKARARVTKRELYRANKKIKEG